MQTRIRIIKRGAGAGTSGPSDKIEKTTLQSERDTANTVKSWIAEWEVRNSAIKAAALSLLGSGVCDGTSIALRSFGGIRQ